MVQESLIEGVLRSLKRNSGWALFIIGLSILATVLLNKYFPTVYKTSTLLRIMTTDKNSGDSLAASIKGAVANRNIIKDALLKNNIDPALATSDLFQLEDAGPGLIKLVVKNENRDLLNDIRNAIVKVISAHFLGYNDERRTFDLMALEKKKSHLENKIKDIRLELAKKRSNCVTHVDESTLELENKIHQLEERIDVNSKRLQTTPEITFTSVVKTSRSYKRIARKLDKARNELADLFQTYMEKHPKVIKKKKEIAKLESRLKKAKRKYKKKINNPKYLSLKSEIDDNLERVATMKLKLRKAREMAKLTVSSSEQKVKELNLEAVTLEKIYQNTLLKLEEQKMCQSTSVGKISVLKNGELSPVPVGFSTIQRDCMTLLSGVLIAVFLLYTPVPVKTEIVSVSGEMLAGVSPNTSANFLLPELKTETIETILEVRSLSPEPLALPAPEEFNPVSSTRFDDRLIALNSPDSPKMTPFKSLLSNLQISISESQTRIVLVASSGANSGKTTLLSNTGILLAQNGYSVLMVDANFRHPSLHRVFDLDNSKGLTDALAEEDASDCIQKTCVPGLSLLTTGMIPANPVELLGSPEMIGLLSSLKRKVEIILIDTPSLLEYPDTGVLAGHTGGMVFLYQKDEPDEDVVRSKRILKKIRAKILGYVTV